ncbi:hypothetical protein LNP74_28475 [Klebsiella pneumoniae subsp. pneumoniae]|nr:hypothetical protein [Klebsiella pneumoniae subsp. pneumoniae]
MGTYATDVNGRVLLQLGTGEEYRGLAHALCRGETVQHDLMALLRTSWLGSHLRRAWLQLRRRRLLRMRTFAASGGRRLSSSACHACCVLLDAQKQAD